VLIRKHICLDLLSPNEDAWKAATLDFLSQFHGVSAWKAQRKRIVTLLANSRPKRGNLIQLDCDEPFTDELGGLQRVHITILYFGWRSEEFRKISSGFLGILTTINAMGTAEMPYRQPVKIRHNALLQIDSVMKKKIYDEIAPQIHTRWMEKFRESGGNMAIRKGESRQVRYRGDDGVWRTPA
jgi:hypothetical protein